MRFTSQGDTLTFSWIYPPGAKVSCSRAFYDVVDTPRTGLTFATPIRPLYLIDRQAGYSLTWSPREELSPERGTGFRYRILCTDNYLGVVWEQELPGIQYYLPSSTTAGHTWTTIQRLSLTIQLVLITTALVFIWIATLLAMLAFTPAKLVALHERITNTGTRTDAATFSAQHPIGLAASLAHSIAAATLLWLGTHRRAQDAWILSHAPKARLSFDQIEIVGKRQIVIDLPVRVDGVVHQRPWEIIDGLCRRSSMALLVTGPGGAGKTTLACQIGRRMLSEAQARVGGHVCIPLLIDRDLRATETEEGFVAFLAGLLRAMVGIDRLSTTLTEALLRSGRLLVIVGGLSERDAPTKAAFDPGRNGFQVMRLIVTSRDSFRGNMSAVLETREIPSDQLFRFIEGYVDAVRRGDGEPKLLQAEIYEACAKLKRLLGSSPTTPLLAGLWAEEVASKLPAQQSPIRGIAELFDSYVERLLAPADGSSLKKKDDLRLDLVAIACRELLGNYLPGWLVRSDVFLTLRERQPDRLDFRYETLLKSRLLETHSRNTEWVRVKLDPIAEHLVARHYVQTLAASEAAWSVFLDEVQCAGCPAGLIDALGACLEHEVYGWLTPVSVKRQVFSLASPQTAYTSSN